MAKTRTKKEEPREPPPPPAKLPFILVELQERLLDTWNSYTKGESRAVMLGHLRDCINMANDLRGWADEQAAERHQFRKDLLAFAERIRRMP